MTLFTFGDSWTEGVGGNIIEERQTNIPEERTKIRHKYCWPKYLSDILEIEVQNFGMGASSNKTIFDLTCQTIHNGLIKKDDLLIVMWSSSLRDPVPFFPTENLWHFWGERYMNKYHIYKSAFTPEKNKTLVNDPHKIIKSEYKEFFIGNLFNDVYYDIVNQNYILYIQFMCEKIGIRYLFCDAFDLMIKKDIINSVNRINLINKKHYWGLGNETLRDYLVGFNRSDVWESNKLWDNSTAGRHPNLNGYELIAKTLYEWIIKNDILTYKTNELKTNII